MTAEARSAPRCPFAAAAACCFARAVRRRRAARAGVSPPRPSFFFVFNFLLSFGSIAASVPAVRPSRRTGRVRVRPGRRPQTQTARATGLGPAVRRQVPAGPQVRRGPGRGAVRAARRDQAARGPVRVQLRRGAAGERIAHAKVHHPGRSRRLVDVCPLSTVRVYLLLQPTRDSTGAAIAVFTARYHSKEGSTHQTTLQVRAAAWTHRAPSTANDSARFIYIVRLPITGYRLSTGHSSRERHHSKMWAAVRL